jgi:hypothetical protein
MLVAVREVQSAGAIRKEKRQSEAFSGSCTYPMAETDHD